MAEVKLKINGKQVKADSNKTILQVVEEQNLDKIPTLCYSPKLPPYGSCFLCVVEVKGLNKLVPACATRVAEGMEVTTNSQTIQESRKTAMELLLSNHYADCVGPCQEGCPANVDVQGYIAYVNQGKYEEAIRLIKETNPLPIVCGRICVRRCEVECRRGLIDEPVAINYLKRYATDMEMGKTIVADKKPPKDKKVAVVGGGPAGLTVSYFLAIEGYDVTIFEAKPELGGMLRYGIPEYRLPKKILDGEINQILGLGVKVEKNVALGKDFTLESLKIDGYDSIYLGLGAWTANSMRVKGEYETEGVYSGLDFLVSQDLEGGMELHGTAVVIGGGNTAVDAARTALRNGAEKVIILYRRSRNEMPADPIEIEAAEHENVEIRFLSSPVGIVAEDNKLQALKCIKMELGEPDSSGRRRPKPIEGSEYELPCDFVFSAIGQKADLECLEYETSEEYELPIELTRWNTIITDEETYETNHEGVFSGGDVVTGPMAVIDAIGMGRKAAFAITSYLETGKAEPMSKEFLSKKEAFGEVKEADLMVEYQDYPRSKMNELPAEERVNNYEEVELGIDRDQSLEESLRCLECGCQQFFDCDLQKYGTDFKADIEMIQGEAQKHEIDIRHPFVLMDSNKCILCHKCIGTCSRMLGESALGLVNRGFNTVVRASYDKSLLETDCNSCGNCIDACPTGALLPTVPYAKPGPWAFTNNPSVCNFCAVGCNVNYRTYTDTLFDVAGEHESFEFPNKGELCVKGRYGYWYMFDEERQLNPMAGERERFVDLSWNKALNRIKENMKKYAPEEIAFFISPRMSNEEIYLLKRLATEGFMTQNVSSFSRLLNNRDNKFNEIEAKFAKATDLDEADAILVANCEPFVENFIVGQQILEKARKGTKLLVVNKKETRLAQYATINEEKITKEIKDLIAEAENFVIVTNKNYTFPKIDLDGAKLLVLSTYSNDFGFDRIIGTPEKNLLEEIEKGNIKAAFIIGENPLAKEDKLLDKVEFLVVMDYFMTETAEKAKVFLPASTYIESGGTMLNYEGRIRKYEQIHCAKNGRANWQVFFELLKMVGLKICDYPTFLDILQEICDKYEGMNNAKMYKFWEVGETEEVAFSTNGKDFIEVDTLNQWLDKNIVAKLEE